VIGLILMFVLNACGAGTPSPTPTLSIEESIGIIVETAVAATRTAQPSYASTQTQTPTPSPTPSATPSLTRIPPTLTPQIVYPVYRCQDSEFVKDISIPDGTVLSPGEVFVKTWKFLNTGTCDWNSRYSIIYLRGDGMRGSDAEIGREVAVNRRVEVSVTMVAPSQPGRYHSHWQLADRFGNPFGDVVIVDIVVANPTATSSPTLDRGSLQIFKTANNPDGATLPVNYRIDYACGSGYAGSVSVAPGTSVIVSGIPIGNACTVYEAPPAPISGYTWGAVMYTPASVVIAAKDQTFSITVGNSITRDRGSLQIIKIINNPDGASVPTSFTVNYNCGTGYTGLVIVAPGSPAIIYGILTGSTCTITEIAPDPIPGYTWGTVAYIPASLVINARDQTFSINVDNSITRDRGSLQIIKTLGNRDGATVPASFNITYDCGTGYTGSVSIAPGDPATVSGIPTGNTCTVTEVDPDPISGFTWSAATYAPASIVITAPGQTFGITVGNSIARELALIPTDPIPNGGRSGRDGYTLGR
jgi:hypothetical protein